MRELKLSQGKTALIDAEDFELLSKFKWSASAQGKGPDYRYYAIRRVRINRVSIKLWLHREIMNCPDDFVVDHINGNGLDNRKQNLRVVPFSENARYAVYKTNSRPNRKNKREEPSL